MATRTHAPLESTVSDFSTARSTLRKSFREIRDQIFSVKEYGFEGIKGENGYGTGPQNRAGPLRGLAKAIPPRSRLSYVQTRPVMATFLWGAPVPHPVTPFCSAP